MAKQAELLLYKPPEYPETLGALIDWAIERVKDPERKILFRMAGTDIALTYAEFGRNVNRICNMLVDLGMKKGDHVAIFLPNCVEYAYLYHSLGKCGAVMAPINPFIRGDPLEYIINHSDSKYLITSHAQFLDKLSPIMDSLGKLKVVLFIDKEAELKGIESTLFSNFRDYPSDFHAECEVSGDDIQGIWYTSGTTGPPKGTVVNHKNYMYRALFYADYFRLTPEDVNYYILPMYHVAYPVWGGPLVMAAGAEIVQVSWFSASQFWKDIVEYRATLTFSTGTIIPIMLKQPLSPDEMQGSGQLKLWVGWPVDDPESVKRRWPGIKFMEGYGTTEGAVATIADYDNPELGNAGPPAPYTDLKILDPETGEELPRNKVGEIVYTHKLDPDYMIKEYYKDPEKSREMIRDGYWHSGDLGMLDDKGRLHFVDRIKDYLRVGGENVSSAVVEDIIRRHPAVEEVAIVAIRGELGHDEMVAHVVPRKGASIAPKEFFEFCNDKMSYFMIPRYLVIRSEMPKTATLRVEKYKLREEKMPPNAIDRVELGIKLRR